MKIFILITLIYNTMTLASDNMSIKKQLLEKNIKEQLEKEKRYSKEQTFYKGKSYNLKDSEVNEESVKTLPEQKNTNDDFNMDSVYD